MRTRSGLSGSLAQLLSRVDGRTRRLANKGAAALLIGVTAIVVLPGSPASADACAPLVNPVACENTKAGTPASVWDVGNAGDDTIQGFATDISVNLGQQVNFKISTPANSYSIDIYRLGYYGGNGARKIASITPNASLAHNQPACITDTNTDIYECGGWRVAASWTVPSTAVSGVYLALLTRGDTGGQSHVPFVVRDDLSHSALFFQTSDTTWQAYNLYGGASFYQGVANGRAFKLSYNRPFATRNLELGRDYLFSNEYPMIRFLERNGYDVSYTTGVDTDRRGALIKNHKVFVSTGHDEYWSGPQRANVEAARDAGVSLAFFSGNEVYWKTRWENSQDGSNTPYRTLVCYKETWSQAKIDPSPEWTGTWRDPRFSPPSNGGRPENGLTGTAYMANSVDLAIQVPEAQGKLRLWRNTSVATQPPGATATLAPHTVGYESDEDLTNGFRPAGLIRLSKTTGPTPEYLRDFGTIVTPGTTTHALTLYRAPSGALVFSTGSIQWAWGLDQSHDGEAPAAADSRMQQATVNLLADMGAQPATLMSGLVAASASTDTQAPTVVITSPADGTTVANGAQVTISGTAADAGGRVAGIEVSTDGGTSWDPATGTTAWTHTFYSHGVGTEVVKVRGIDDSANIATSPASLTLNLTGPSNLFGNRVPATPAATDASAVEVGTKFTSQSDGTVVGVRFYKGTGNTGVHTGSLWDSNGNRLATGTFINETSTGWQTLNFAEPVSITRNTVYIASYKAPAGHYAADSNFFSLTAFNSSPLTGPRSTTTSGNGVYRVGSGFPVNSYADTNYWVDPLFVDGDSLAPTVLTVTPAAGATGQSVNTKPTARFSKSIDPATIVFTLKNSANATVTGTTAYDEPTHTATFVPSSALSIASSYTATVNARDLNGTPMAAPMTWSFTTTQYENIVTLFAENAVPANSTSQDPSAVSLGVKFAPSVDGQVVGVRFYKGPGNTGTHIGSLWTLAGDRLATATFTAETGSGWQSVQFSTPVNVTANTTYVVSYYAPNGNYPYNGNFFATTYTNGPLSAPAGANGVYTYGADTFPLSSWGSSNYWVDPMFIATPPPPPPPPGNPPPMPSGAVTILRSTETPASASWNDSAAIELGVSFRADVSGAVHGIRFYKGTGNTGTHTGSLWTSTGQLLATATFGSESDTGWQLVLFSTPVNITAGTTYVASYHTTTGHYAVTGNQFAVPYDNPPLHVVTTGGAYQYGAGGFPANQVNHNYWVDIAFVPAS